MGKEAIKAQGRKEQRRLCALCGDYLSEEDAMVDTDRPVPKASGGEYLDQNVRIVHPWCHMERHGIRRVRPKHLEMLKAGIDDRQQMIKLQLKIENQIRAYKRRTDHLSEITLRWLDDESQRVAGEVKNRDKLIVEQMKIIKQEDALAEAALGVKCIGPMTVAHLFVYVKLEEARHASSLWAYTGLDKASHERYEKGIAGGGNKTLRCCLWNAAQSQIKQKGPYREIYDNIKHRLEMSDKITKTRNTQGKLIESKWKDTKPCHRHGAAIRAVMKHLLADYWFVGRTLYGLPTSPGYAEAMLGHEGHKTIDPETRGWKY